MTETKNGKFEIDGGIIFWPKLVIVVLFSN